MRIWISSEQRSREFPLVIQDNRLSYTLRPNQKIGFERWINEVNLVLTIDNQQIRPAHFNASFDILPFSRNNITVYETPHVTMIYPTGYDFAGQFTGDNTEKCYSIAREYFGKAVPTNRLYHYIEISQGNIATAALSLKSAWTRENLGNFQQLVTGDRSICQSVNLHEIIHMYFFGTPKPGWMNEGIAETLTHRLVENPTNENLTCFDDHWEAWNGLESHPYLELDGGANPQSEWYYATPRCFIKYLDDFYGGDALKKIIERIFAYQRMGIRHDAWCTPEFRSFLRTILADYFGTDIIPVATTRFGIENYTCN